MPVILLMAAKTSRGGVLELEGHGVTLNTRRAGMRAKQFEEDIMIEGGCFPVCGDVTGFTERPFAPDMFIVLLVAANTRRRRILEFVKCGVALFTGNIFVRASQGKTGQGVIKMGIIPALFGVAVLANDTQILSVGVVFQVAVRTAGQGCFEISQLVRPGMAPGTGQSGVRPNQHESRLCMVKMLIHALFSIVAGPAIGRILADMRRHEGLVEPLMAVSAIAGLESLVSIEMAVLADESCAIRGRFVRGGGKTEQVVREIIQPGIRQRRIRAAMFGMAVAASQYRLVVEQNPMQLMRIGQFLLDVGVTANTAILHEIGIPGRGVALITVPADLDMRADIPEQRARDGVQFSRAEKAIPLGKHNP
jgi:hypothetical protein